MFLVINHPGQQPGRAVYHTHEDAIKCAREWGIDQYFETRTVTITHDVGVPTTNGVPDSDIDNFFGDEHK